mgnify:CR=1 FL=1
MAIPEEVINEIKYRNDIETAISQYVVLKRRGKNLVGLCPFHSEKTPSFTVYPENGSFYCFGCGVGGDVFTFTGLIENLDYIESVKLLCEQGHYFDCANRCYYAMMYSLKALLEYKGSVLLICHEPEFYRDVVNEVWDCTKWTTKVI